jgi:hypothetical protein
MDERQRAVELIELARNHPDYLTLWLTVQHVHRLQQEHDLPFATPNTLQLAHDAIDHAVRLWLGDNFDALGQFRTVKALLEEAERQGHDILGDAISYLNERPG